MKSIAIHGKPYVPVNERIKAFRTQFDGYSLISEIIQNDEKICLIKASILDEERNIVATGHAYERPNSSNINKTSHIENCETSAWGRALAAFGIGVDNEVASYDEVARAVESSNSTAEKAKQTNKKNNGLVDEVTKNTLLDFKQAGQNLSAALKRLKISSIEEMTQEQADKLIDWWTEKANKEAV